MPRPPSFTGGAILCPLYCRLTAIEKHSIAKVISRVLNEGVDGAIHRFHLSASGVHGSEVPLGPQDMRRQDMRLPKILWILTLLLAAVLPLAAQQTSAGGSLTGTVLDPQGAVVPAAVVTVTNVDRGTSQATKTNAAGIFLFPQLPPGNYTVTVEMAGFKKFSKSNIVLTAYTNLSVGNLTLVVGSVAQTVEVTAQGMQLQTQSAARADTIVGTQLKNIEVNGRSPLALLRVLPGIVTTFDTSLANNQIQNININGARSSSLNATLNGVDNLDMGSNNKLFATVSTDALEEFTVLRSNYGAQYGKASGGTIMMVTKSGTKDFHGTAYWYYRDRGMNANTWSGNRDNVRKPGYHFNYLGFTVGGPVYIPGRFNTNKNKLFFFWSEEYQRQLIPGNVVHDTFPTALEASGDFSQSVDKNVAYGGTPDSQYIHDPSLPAGHCKAGDTANCFQGGGVIGKIPISGQYAPGIALLSNLYNVANKACPTCWVTGQKGYNYQWTPLASEPRHERVIRGDYNLNDKWRFWGSWTQLVQDAEKGDYVGKTWTYSLNPNYPLPGGVQYYHPGYSLSTNLTTTLSPTSTNEFTFGIGNHPVTVLPIDSNSLTRTATGINLPTFYAPFADWIPKFTFGGSKLSNTPNLQPGGGAMAPFQTYNTILEFADNYSKVLGNHILRAGAYLQRNRKNQTAFVQSGGNYDFGDSSSNPLDTGFGFANAAAGVYSSFSQASNMLTGQYRYTNFEWYLQDTWKVKPRVTLDLGLRAYLIQPWFDQAFQISTFTPNKYDPTQAAQLFWPCFDASGNKIGVNRQDCNLSAPGVITTAQYLPSPASLFIGKIVPNSGSLTDGVQQAGVGINKYLMQFPGIRWAPRFGMAIDLTGRGNFVFRAGAGAYPDRYQGNEIFNIIANPPSVFTPTVYNGFASGISSSALGSAFLAPSDLTAISPDGQVPTNYNFSAGIQSKLPYAMVLDVAYVGAVGRELLYNTNINGAPYGSAFLTQYQDPTKWGFGNTPICDAANPCDGSKAYDSNYVRPYYGWGNITLEHFGQTSNYNSLQITLDRRFARGLFMGLAYTWSKCLTPADNDGAGGRIDGFTKLANYGPCGYDVRQNFTVNYVYPIPSLAGHFGGFNNPVGRGVFNGWQVSGVTTFRSGTPFTPGYSISGVSSVNLTGTGAFGSRIKLIGVPTQGTSDSPYDRLNAAAFAPPTRPSLGLESGVNYVYNPGQNNWDMSLQRDVKLNERAHLEFRLDAFNAFNHTQFSGLNGTVNFNCGSLSTNCSSYTVTNLPYNSSGQLVNKNGFGTVNGVYNPRVLQTVVRFVF
jgi:Carboxypeptidase regulatory-like domain/TonB-dependent Receptor Plug Domain